MPERYYAVPDEVASDDDLLDLWKIASEANDGDREWTWKGGYPQTVLRRGDVVLVAHTYESPDHPARFAEFIAAFDPPAVLALIRRAALAGALPQEGKPSTPCATCGGTSRIDLAIPVHGPPGHERHQWHPCPDCQEGKPR